MSVGNQTFTITLPEHVIEALHEAAAKHGTTPGKYAAALLEQVAQPIKWILPDVEFTPAMLADQRLHLVPDHTAEAAEAYEGGWRDGLLKMSENISGVYTLIDAGGEVWAQYRSLLKRDAELGPLTNPYRTGPMASEVGDG